MLMRFLLFLAGISVAGADPWRGVDGPGACPPGLCDPLIDAIDLERARVPSTTLDGIVAVRTARERQKDSVGSGPRKKRIHASAAVDKDGRVTSGSAEGPGVDGMIDDVVDASGRGVDFSFYVRQRPGAALVLVGFVVAALYISSRACSRLCCSDTSEGSGRYARVFAETSEGNFRVQASPAERGSEMSARAQAVRGWHSRYEEEQEDDFQGGGSSRISGAGRMRRRDRAQLMSQNPLNWNEDLLS